MKKLFIFGAALSMSTLAHAAPYEGTCGTTDAACHYVLNTTDSTLSITGNGAMSNYLNGGEIIPKPWDNNRNYIKTINISGITSIGMFAFVPDWNGTYPSLTSVVLSNTVTSIGQGAFYGCTKLTSIDIPSSVNTITDDVFSHCTGLTTITFRNNMFNAQGSMIFNDCPALRTVYSYSDVPSANIVDLFAAVPLAQCTLYVPCLSRIAYSITGGWNEFGTILPMGACDVSQIQAQLDAANAQISALTTEKNNLQTQLTACQSGTCDMTVLQAMLSTLTSEVNASQAQVRALTRENNLQQTQITNLQSQVSAQTTENASLQAQNSNLQLELSACQANPTAVVAESLPQLMVSPNPVVDVLYITEEFDGIVEVYDLSGMLVMTSTENPIKISSLKSGMYIVKAGGKAAKIVKQ